MNYGPGGAPAPPGGMSPGGMGPGGVSAEGMPQRPRPAINVETLTESCLFKAGVSTVAGAGLGLFFGLFFGGYANAVDQAVDLEGTTGQKLRVGFRSAAKAMGGYARSFAMFGLIYSGSECAVEKFRARHDIYNAMAAGCITGGTISSQPRSPIGGKARATQMAVGCAGMAAFSAAVDYYIEYWH
mmetsp:Transcript_13239/g.40698  ORF Transcript_13239/g.40698 Transcript_13239/m.40698 type:complete len:185 (-) Transcript_13239:642-1196(-)